MSFGGNATSDQDSYDLVDLYGFAQRLEETGAFADAGRALQAAVRDAVVYRNTGELVATSANGLSVFFPSRSLGLQAKQTLVETYKPIASPSYNKLLNVYVEQAQQLPRIINIVTPTITANVMQSNIMASLGIKEAYAILSEDDGGPDGKIRIDGVMRADFTSDYGGATLDLSKGWLMLNGKPFAIVATFPEYDEAGDVVAYRYIVPILRNGMPASLEVRETVDDDRVEVIGSWEGIVVDRLTARAGDPIVPDDDITLLRVVIDVAAQTAEVTKNPMASFKAGGMVFARSALPAGNYKLRFAVTDFAETDKFSASVGYTVP
jgi:hypothetical protein